MDAPPLTPGVTLCLESGAHPPAAPEGLTWLRARSTFVASAALTHYVLAELGPVKHEQPIDGDVVVLRPNEALPLLPPDFAWESVVFLGAAAPRPDQRTFRLLYLGPEQPPGRGGFFGS